MKIIDNLLGALFLIMALCLFFKYFADPSKAMMLKESISFIANNLEL
ncbi:MAG: hypothetical protein QJR05_09910 [Thermoanaerobacterium sp.]|nr:hypothetical protein [Thermoanaerobacterium sp.]